MTKALQYFAIAFFVLGFSAYDCALCFKISGALFLMLASAEIFNSFQAKDQEAKERSFD